MNLGDACLEYSAFVTILRISPLLYLPIASICVPRTLMSSIALFRLPHNWTIPFQRFFLQFNIFTQHLACARAVAWRPVQANTLHCVAFHIRANAFCSKCIDFIFSLYVAALSRKYILPTKARFRLVERNDYSEMLLNSSRASKAAFLCNLCGWQRAVCCRWQDDRPSAAQAWWQQILTIVQIFMARRFDKFVQFRTLCLGKSLQL